jgi:ribosomal subunit interface protein
MGEPVQIQIAARQCEISKRLLDRTEQQIQKLTKYDPRIHAAEVVFKEERHSKSVEIVLHISGAESVVAHGEEPDFRAALDRALDRVVRMLKRQRQRQRDHQAPPVAEGTGAL